MFFNRWIQDNVLKSSLVHSLGVIWNDYNPSTDKAAVGMSCCSSLLVVFTETVSETLENKSDRVPANTETQNWRNVLFKRLKVLSMKKCHVRAGSWWYMVLLLPYAHEICLQARHSCAIVFCHSEIHRKWQEVFTFEFRDSLLRLCLRDKIGPFLAPPFSGGDSSDYFVTRMS